MSTDNKRRKVERETGLLKVEHYNEYREADCASLQLSLRCDQTMAERCYSSQLIGKRASLVLHGGGNCSVKLTESDVFGEETEWLAVKGSGYDLSNIVPRGFPLVRLPHLQKLASLPTLPDDVMVNEFRASLKDSTSPTPSVESLLHALIKGKFVDHSHASAIVALACQTEAKATELFKAAFAGHAELNPFCIVPYVMPGFDLAVAARKVLNANPNCKMMILMKHGLFTWGESARESYERHVLAVNCCERLISGKPGMVFQPKQQSIPVSTEFYSRFASMLRGVLQELDPKQGNWIVSRRPSALAEAFVWCDQSQNGCCTPDHVIRTKRVPLVIKGISEEEMLRERLKNEVAGFAQQYMALFEANKRKGLVPLDPLPRVLLVENIGLVTVGRTFSETQISADIYEESMKTILSAVNLSGEFLPASPKEVFDMEYWVLEQAKLKSSATSLPLSGQVCLVTGGGSGIGLATARKFAKEGAAVFVVDRDPQRVKDSGFKGCVADVTQRDCVASAFQDCVSVFGGVDVVVSNAGVFNCGHVCWEAADELDESMRVNFSSHHHVSSEAMRVFVNQGTGGCLLFNVSKAPLNPGPKAGAYAIAKAATGALMRQLALEGAEFGVTSNAVNADRVRTNLFDEDLVAGRAKARNLSVDQYFSANLLKREVTSQDVADAFFFLCMAKKTTGTYFCVDGGCLAK